MSVLFKNATVLTMELENSVLHNTNVLVDGTKIAYIGEEEKQADRVIDCTNKLIMPGFVNTHTHVPMCLFRSYADDMVLFDWLNMIWPLEDKMDEDIITAGSMLGYAEMIRTGTTCFLDMYNFEEQITKACVDAGLRGVLSRGLVGDVKDGLPKLAENIDLFKKWNGYGDDLIKVFLAPHAEYTSTKGYIAECVKAAKEYDIPMHIHISETKKEHEECIERHGKTPIKYFNDLGALDTGLVAAHCVYVTEEDMDILAEKKATVAHNPASNLKLASGFAPLKRMLEKGINVSLGTDGAASNNNLDMHKEMLLAAIMHKGYSGDPTLMTPGQILRMATINGAKALGYDDLGMVKEGFKADLIMIDLENPRYYPRNNIESLIVYAGNSEDVCLTMVNGKTLYENGNYTTINVDKVNETAQLAFDKLLSLV